MKACIGEYWQRTVRHAMQHNQPLRIPRGGTTQ